MGVLVLDACFCTYDGLLFGDGCIGCMASTTALCLEYEFCCKSGVEPLGCFCCAIRCVEVTVCIKQQQQICCFVGAMAIPPDDEVPPMFTFPGLPGLVLYPQVVCCKKLGEINGQDKPEDMS